METKLKLGGTTRTVTLVRSPKGGERDDEAVQVARIGTHWLRLRIDGNPTSLHVVRSEAGTWVWHDGRARFRAEQSERIARRAPKAGLGGAVTPPMPATVVRILVEAGQQVERGADLIVVSAMKMETTLKAPYTGVVRAVNATVGSTVRPGEILVDIEQAEDGVDNKS